MLHTAYGSPFAFGPYTWYLNAVRRQVRDTLSNPHATADLRLFSQSLRTRQ